MPKTSADTRSAMERRRSARLQSKDLSPAGRPLGGIVCKEEQSSPSKTSKGDVRRSTVHTPIANADKKVAEASEPGTPRTRHKNRGDTSPIIHDNKLKDVADDDLGFDTNSDSNHSDGARSDTDVVAAKSRKYKLHKKGKLGVKAKKDTDVNDSQKTSTPRKEARDPTRGRESADTPRSRTSKHDARRRSPKATSLPGTPTQQGNKHHTRKATAHRKRSSSSVPAAEMPSSDEKQQLRVREVCLTSANTRPHHSRKLAKALLDDDVKGTDLNAKCTTGDGCNMQCSVVLQAHMYAEQYSGCRAKHDDVLCPFDAVVKSETPLECATGCDTNFKCKLAPIDHTYLMTTGMKIEQPMTKQSDQYWPGSAKEVSPNRNENTNNGLDGESVVSEAEHGKFVVTTATSCNTDIAYPTSATIAHLRRTPPSTKEPKSGEHQGDTGTQKVRPAAACWVNATGDSESWPTRGDAVGKAELNQQQVNNELHAVKSTNTMSAMIPNPFTIQHGLQQTFDFAAFQPVSPPSRRDMLDADFTADLQPGQETHRGRVARIDSGSTPVTATTITSGDCESTRTPDSKTSARKVRATPEGSTTSGTSRQVLLDGHGNTPSRVCHSRLKTELCRGSGGSARERKYVAESKSCTYSTSKETKQSPKPQRRAIRTKSGRQKHLSALHSSKQQQQQALAAAAGCVDRAADDDSADVTVPATADVYSNICESWLAPLLGLDPLAPNETSGQSDAVSRWRYKQTAQWRQQAFSALVSRWDEYLRIPADEMRKFEMQNARDFDYNSEARSLIEDKDLYVWQLIDQLNADFEPKHIDEFGKF